MEALKSHSWIYALFQERLLEELEKRELVQTGMVSTMRAKLLRYEQSRARGEDAPPTPESATGNEAARLTVPQIDNASAHPDSPSIQG